MVPITRTVLQHHALLYNDDQVLASLAAPFVREGLDRGERVFLGSRGAPVAPLLAALFGAERGVTLTERNRYSRPVAVLDQYQRAMDAGLRQGVPGFRAIEFTAVDDTEVGWQEWLRLEASVNRVFADYPLRTLCPCDVRRLDGRAAAFAAAHPCLLEADGGERPNEEYVDPVELVNRPEHLPKPDPLEAGPPVFDAEVGSDLRRLRVDIYPVTMASELPRLKVDDFVKAIGSVVLNSWAHGKPPVRLRIWAGPHRLLCAVTDRGAGIADPFAGYVKPRAGPPGEPIVAGGFGLWAARQLCDTLDYASDAAGFTVRLRVRG